MDIESDDSERWEDFFGSSTDLTPSLIGLYDSLTGSLNEAQNHKVITASEEEVVNNHNHNIQLKQQPHLQSTTDDTTAAATSTTTIPSSTTTTTTKITTNSITDTSSDNNFSVNIEDEDTVVVDKNKIHSSSTINNNTNISSSKHRSFRILSPNVQRLISHSNTTAIIGKLESLESSIHHQIQCNNNSSSSNSTNISCSNYSTTNTNNNNNNNINFNSIRSLRKIIGKHKLSHIPLSRNTCKLTQAGNELVETFETSSSSSSSSLSNNILKLSCESLDRIIPTLIITSPPSSLENHLEMNKLLSETNEINETTTTKTIEYNNKFEMCSKENTSDRKSPSITMGNITSSSSSKSEINKTLTATHSVAKNRVAEIAKFFHLSSSSMTTSSTSPVQELLQNSSITEDDTEEIGHLPLIDNQLINECVSNESAISQYESTLNDSSVSVKDFNQKNDIKSSVNKISNDENIPKIEITASSIETTITTAPSSTSSTTTTSSISSPITSSTTTSKKYTPPSSPLLTYARAKVLASNNKPLSLVGGINTQQQQRITRKLSIENLDKDMKILTTTSTILGNNQHGTKLSPKCNRKTNLILPDIAKLKHRPLSSSSICSTSSSSSSGSDNLLNSKLGVSYLASVESLADQSENELLDGHNNNHGLNHHHHNNLMVFERACLEIIDSERSYVEDLRQIITGYLEDWKERACLKLDELKILFSNIQEIYDFNSILLKQLINSGMDPLKIAKCFIELKNNFTVYTIYCTSYPEAISLLTQLLQASHTNALLTSTQKMLQHTLPLGSYLLKPVQRILKYHLLLDNLRKHCDIEEVVQAYDIMRQVARDIDQVKRKLEQQSRVKELSGILDGWLGPELTVLGELRQEGLLMENNKARMVFLFQTMLIITKPKEDNRLQFKSYIYRNNLMLREHLPGEPTSFNVIPYDEPRNQIKLTAKNRDQKKLWAQNIKGVILEQFDIPNRAKELVYKLGDEEDRTPDKNIWKWNFNSSTPVYLERRNQYRRSELRSRSKSKRKFLTNSTSFEGFLDNKNKNDDFEDNNEVKRHQLLRKQSIDDTMISSLSNHHHNSFHHKNHHYGNHSQNECNCDYDLIKNENRNIMRIKSYISNGKPIKERSKSVPRIPSSVTQNVDGDSDDEYFIRSSTSDRKKIGSNNNNINNNNNITTSTLGRTKSSKSIEFKNYTTKSIPKRIANLKKSRQKKETSKFYMDLNDFEDTVLKITESSENLSVQEKQNDELKPTIENLLLLTEMTKDNNKEEEAKEAEEAEENNKEIILENVDEINKNEEIIENIEKLNELNDKIDDIDGKSKNDVEIISELLKDKGFDRILKKPPKKRSFDNGRHLSSPEPNDIGDIIINSISTSTLQSPSKTPPPPPPSSPPPLNTEDDDEENINNLPKTSLIQDLEPIYESLLRNVHVPYKFSPILNRSKSQQYYTNTFNELKLTKCSNRPESDYVTLVYTENGDLHSIDNAIVKRIVSTDILRNSDSNINYENVTEIETNINNTSSTNQVTNSFSSENDLQEQIIKSTQHKNLIQRLISSKVENVSISENSLLPRVRKSVDNISLGFGKHNKPPERRVSDVTEMCRQSIIHRQGSEAVGERMANLDYVDPKTLFSNSVNSSAISLNPQRDSVFSLTSSNDSVCDSKRKQSQNEISSFIYEDNVEACLENDFRDSAVYSDDNERRQDIYEHQNNDNSIKNNIKLKRPSSPPPPPPPPRRNFASNNGSGGMKITSPVSPVPPPIPAKPNLPSLKRAFSNAASLPPITTTSLTIVTSTDNNIKTLITDSITTTPTTTATITPAISPTGSGGKSWVLLQIENFNK